MAVLQKMLTFRNVDMIIYSSDFLHVLLLLHHHHLLLLCCIFSLLSITIPPCWGCKVRSCQGHIEKKENQIQRSW